MLAEQFFLTLETIISHSADAEPTRHPDGSPRSVCRQHIPIKLSEIKPPDQAQSQTVE